MWGHLPCLFSVDHRAGGGAPQARHLRLTPYSPHPCLKHLPEADAPDRRGCDAPLAREQTSSPAAALCTYGAFTTPNVCMKRRGPHTGEPCHCRSSLVEKRRAGRGPREAPLWLSGGRGAGARVQREARPGSAPDAGPRHAHRPRAAAQRPRFRPPAGRLRAGQSRRVLDRILLSHALQRREEIRGLVARHLRTPRHPSCSPAPWRGGSPHKVFPPRGAHLQPVLPAVPATVTRHALK